MNRREFVGLGLLSLPALSMAAPLLRDQAARVGASSTVPRDAVDSDRVVRYDRGWLAGAPRPSFSFGVVTDVHWSNENARGRRDYRASIPKLRQSVAFWNTQQLDFVIQCGDFVDGGTLATINEIDSVFNTATARRHSVLGNHDFVAFPRTPVVRALGMPSAYYSFTAPEWRFIVLDGLNASEIGWRQGSPEWQRGHAIRSRLIARHAPDSFHWDGAVGPEQRHWLKGELALATANHEKVIVFCHIPTLPGSCRRGWLLWDHADVIKVLDTCPNLVAYMCGHDHLGGYGERNGVQYVTYPALVENSAAAGTFVVDVYGDHLVVRNMLGQHRLLPFQRNALGSAVVAG